MKLVVDNTTAESRWRARVLATVCPSCAAKPGKPCDIEQPTAVRRRYHLRRIADADRRAPRLR